MKLHVCWICRAGSSASESTSCEVSDDREKHGAKWMESMEWLRSRLARVSIAAAGEEVQVLRWHGLASVVPHSSS